MNLTLVITPSGHLRLEEAEEVAPLSETTAAALQSAFGTSSAEGLLLLATPALDAELPAELVFWRGFARDLYCTICIACRGPRHH